MGGFLLSDAREEKREGLSHKCLGVGNGTEEEEGEKYLGGMQARMSGPWEVFFVFKIPHPPLFFRVKYGRSRLISQNSFLVSAENK